MAIASPTIINFDDLKKSPPANVYEMTFTPDQCRRIAKATVGAEVNFRKLADSDSRMKNSVEAMKSGRWEWRDADPIRLHIHTETGELVCTDGQHRLWAASVAWRNLRTLVLFGPEWIGGLNVDRNRTRSVSQYLADEHGIRNAAFASIARIELGRISSYHHKSSLNSGISSVSDDAIIALVVNNQNEIGWAVSRSGIGSARGFHTTGYGMFLYEALTISHELASQFHEDMKQSDLDPIDPLAQLKKAVAGRFSATGHRSHRDYTISNLVKAWNARATGQTLTKWINAGDDVFFPSGFKVPPVSILSASGDTAPNNGDRP